MLGLRQHLDSEGVAKVSAGAFWTVLRNSRAFGDPRAL